MVCWFKHPKSGLTIFLLYHDRWRGIVRAEWFDDFTDNHFFGVLSDEGFLVIQIAVGTSLNGLSLSNRSDASW